MSNMTFTTGEERKQEQEVVKREKAMQWDKLSNEGLSFSWQGSRIAQPTTEERLTAKLVIR